MLALNEILQGRYRILRRLGHGGMGAVYEAMDERFGSTVALKEIIIDLDRVQNASQQAMMRHAFEREARILAHLHHEAFPHVRDYFAETDRQFLVMELIGGEDLADLLARQQAPFLLEDVLKWADQLLDALDYLHTLEMPIIHRDLKPQNLKLTARGKIKLLDFGIAKGTDAQIANTMTNKTFIAATLNYSPLEQILPVLDPTVREFIIYSHGEKVGDIVQQPTDARSDLYALGATLYHLSTGAQPTDALKRTLEIWAGKPDPLPAPASINPSIPNEISDIFLKAMEAERENRFASAKEMREALHLAAANRRPVEEEAKYLLWLAQQDRLKAEQDKLNNAPQAFETQPQQPENQTVENTDPISGVPTQNSSEFTQQSYLAAILPEPPSPEPPKPEPPRREMTVETLPAAPKKPVAVAPQKNRKILWLLPIAALLLLTLGGAIFGMWWILGKNGKETAKPTPVPTTTADVVVETTPEPSPSPASTFENLNVAPTQSPKNTPASQTPIPNLTPKPTAAPTSTPVILPPTPRPSTPTPRPPTPTRTPSSTRTPQPGCPQPPPRGCRQSPTCIIEC
jgi:serine/threonine protein kinase